MSCRLLLLLRSSCPTRSARSWRRGRGGGPARRRWRCARGSCWLAAEGLQEHRDRRAARGRRPTVTKWRSRFAEHRLDGLTRRAAAGAAAHDHRRAGRGGDRQDAGDARRRTRRTGRRARWPREVGLTQTAVLRIWQAFGLQPHRQETWKLSKDPLFIDKVRDVVGLYLNPPERAVVLCVDEKSQIQALDRTAPILPMLPGHPRARHPRLQARRHLEPLRRAGPHDRQGHRPRCTAATARSSSSSSCRRIDREVPADLDVHLVLDNSSTHKTPAIQRWLAAHPRFVLHFTPTSSSWLNLVERWFAELTTKKLRRGAHRSVRAAQRRHPRLDRDLERRSHALRLDQDRRPDPRIDRRYCKRINESRH